MQATVIRFQDRCLRIYFKYECLPTFCFSYGKIGHQVKDCEALKGKEEEGFEDIKEIELSFGTWPSASPLLKTTYERKTKYSPGNCNKNLFALSSSSKCNASSGVKVNEEIVEQPIVPRKGGILLTPVAPKYAIDMVGG